MVDLVSSEIFGEADGLINKIRTMSTLDEIVKWKNYTKARAVISSTLDLLHSMIISCLTVYFLCRMHV